ncbi:MAG: amidase [Anaerolineales bacterium]|jgi:aspartyl-tRNA(Asn)/glutamyl-tRNA(Gln) amidotransferase subunit A
MSFTNLTILQAAELIARREISPVELVQAHLERIERIDSQINSYITLTAELAMDQARQAEAALAVQKPDSELPSLHGIPLALKDLVETQGVRTTAGSLFFSDNIPERDAMVVEKLKSAGAVLLGKLNMHEIALGVTNENPHFGDCKNPWDVARSPGGSSGGSGAALAAELCLGSVGSDTGGSIRIPASLCGIVGLKPTFGRVSKRGVLPLSWHLDHVGPMARCVQDVAILLGVMAGYDPHDPDSVDVPLEDYLVSIEDGVRGWRIAVASDAYFSKEEKQVKAALQEAAGVFEDLGAEVSEVEIPQGREIAQANGRITTSEAAFIHRHRLDAQPDRFGADVLERLKSGKSVTTQEYIQARRVQAKAQRQFDAFFKTYDLLLTATTAIPAPLRGSAGAVERAKQLLPYTSPFNLTGLPALSIPCGFTEEGLPIGMQIVGPLWAEARVLRSARAYERATDWQLRSVSLAA